MNGTTKAAPAQRYTRITEGIYARQFTGSNQQDMIEFAPAYLYLTPEGVLMQVQNPFPVVAAEWVCQWRNGVQMNQFFRQTDDIFKATWAIGGP